MLCCGLYGFQSRSLKKRVKEALKQGSRFYMASCMLLHVCSELPWPITMFHSESPNANALKSHLFLLLLLRHKGSFLECPVRPDDPLTYVSLSSAELCVHFWKNRQLLETGNLMVRSQVTQQEDSEQPTKQQGRNRKGPQGQLPIHRQHLIYFL